MLEALLNALLHCYIFWAQNLIPISSAFSASPDETQG